MNKIGKVENISETVKQNFDELWQLKLGEERFSFQETTDEK